MNRDEYTPRISVTDAFLLAYGAASLAHHIHNAELLSSYPNMPAALSRATVYGAWLGVTAIGVVGYALLRSRHHVAGLVTLAIYAAFGLDGLAHYVIAPFAAHTLTMHLTIGLEVVTACLLLAHVSYKLATLQRQLPT